MTDNKIVDISQRKLGFSQKGNEQGMGIMGSLFKKICGVDLLKVAVIMKTIEPLLRIQRQNPKTFERRRAVYVKIVNTYQEKTYLPLINNSSEEQWKRRPIFFALLIQKVLGEKIHDFPQT